MKKMLLIAAILMLAGCALPAKSPTKLERSPCACGDDVSARRHV